MTPITSFAPTAARLEVLAVKIRSDLEGRILIEQIYGIMFCMMLYYLARVCHQLEARVEAEAAACEARGEVAGGGAGSPAIQHAPGLRSRLIVVGASEAPATASPGMRGNSAASAPTPNEAGRHSPNHARQEAGDWPRLRGWRKMRDFRFGHTHEQFVAI